MGYSCSCAADNTLAAIETGGRPKGQESSNTIALPNGKTGFIERGRENEDGAITGTIWQNLPDNKCRKYASLRIDKNGAVIRPAFVRRYAQIGIGQLKAENCPDYWKSVESIFGEPVKFLVIS